MAALTRSNVVGRSNFVGRPNFVGRSKVVGRLSLVCALALVGCGAPPAAPRTAERPEAPASSPAPTPRDYHLTRVPVAALPTPADSSGQHWLMGGVRYALDAAGSPDVAESIGPRFVAALATEGVWLFQSASGVWRADSFLGALEAHGELPPRVTLSSPRPTRRGWVFVGSDQRVYGVDATRPLAPLQAFETLAVAEVGVRGDTLVAFAVGEETWLSEDGGRTSRRASGLVAMPEPPERAQPDLDAMLSHARAAHIELSVHHPAYALAFGARTSRLGRSRYISLGSEYAFWVSPGGALAEFDGQGCEPTYFPLAFCGARPAVFHGITREPVRLEASFAREARVHRALDEQRLLVTQGCAGELGLLCLIDVREPSATTLPFALPLLDVTRFSSTDMPLLLGVSGPDLVVGWDSQVLFVSLADGRAQAAPRPAVPPGASSSVSVEAPALLGDGTVLLRRTVRREAVEDAELQAHLVTRDGVTALPLPPRSASVAMASAHTGFAASPDGARFYTDDGGAHWASLGGSAPPGDPTECGSWGCVSGELVIHAADEPWPDARLLPRDERVASLGCAHRRDDALGVAREATITEGSGGSVEVSWATSSGESVRASGSLPTDDVITTMAVSDRLALLRTCPRRCVLYAALAGGSIHTLPIESRPEFVTAVEDGGVLGWSLDRGRSQLFYVDASGAVQTRTLQGPPDGVYVDGDERGALYLRDARSSPAVGEALDPRLPPRASAARVPIDASRPGSALEWRLSPEHPVCTSPGAGTRVYTPRGAHDVNDAGGSVSLELRASDDGAVCVARLQLAESFRRSTWTAEDGVLVGPAGLCRQ